jgi:hypothetical protein
VALFNVVHSELYFISKPHEGTAVGTYSHQPVQNIDFHGEGKSIVNSFRFNENNVWFM